MTAVDQWGQEMTGSPATVAAWDRAWQQFLHFRGDPFVDLVPHLDDEENVLGPTFVALYQVLGGIRLDADDVVVQAQRARDRAADAGRREQAHADALASLVRGDFSEAGARWADIAGTTDDFSAVRFAHDVFLHVGDADGRLASSRRAFDRWSGRPGESFIGGQLCFALEECGHYEEATEIGLAALDADPDDLWARHALAHVYEHLDDTPATLDLLETTVDRWRRQDLLATHVWWHLALRLLAIGDVTRALEIFDHQLPTATTPFRLCDQASLLWRIELDGHEVGDRWDVVADRFAALAERHNCAFIDLHATITFLRRPTHPGAAVWAGGLADRASGSSENDHIFETVLRPVLSGFEHFVDGDHAAATTTWDDVDAPTRLLGGSVAQRQLLELTRQAASGGSR